jgi:hypothetical protein
MGGWSDDTPEQGIANMMFADVLSQREQASADWSGTGLATQTVNTAVRAVDSTAASLYNVIPLLGDVESFAPSKWTNYHRNRGTYDAIAAVPLLFAGVGAATRGLKVGGALHSMAVNATGNHRALDYVFNALDEVREVDALMGAARLKTSTSVAALTGRTVPAFDLSAKAGATLAKYGETYGEVARHNNIKRTVEAVKEGVGQELAIAALMNSNEFLFPEGGSTFMNLAFAGAGIGLNLGIEHAVGRAVMRKAVSNAGRAGGDAALQSQAFTEGQAVKGVVGEEWQNAASSLFGAEYLDNLDRSAPQISADSNGLVSVEVLRSAYKDLKKAGQENLETAYSTMFNNRLAVRTLREGFGTSAAVSRSLPGQTMLAKEMAERGRTNMLNTVGLAELVDNQAAARFETLKFGLADRRAALDKNLAKAADAKDVARLNTEIADVQARVKELDGFHVGTVERSGSVNLNPRRLAPAWETPVKDMKVRNSADSVALDGSVSGARQLHLSVTGGLEVRDGFGPLMKRTTVAAQDLSFDEITALQVLVGRVAKNGNKVWADQFWKNFAIDPNIRADNLPFPVLDAIQSGLLPLPSGALSPKIGQLKSAIDAGRLTNAALAAKLEWFKVQGGGGLLDTMDAFDLEKALNLGLTDRRGGENLLMKSLRGYAADKSGATAAQILEGANANAGTDRLLDLGAGYAGVGGTVAQATLTPDFYKGVRGLGNLAELDRSGGIGAVYHKIDLPTDTEMQVAKVAALRQNFRMNRLSQSQNPIVSLVHTALAGDEVALLGVRQGVHELFEGAGSKGNLATQTTWANRNVRAIQHAHALGQTAQKALDTYTTARLGPVLQRVKTLYQSNQRVKVFAEFSAGQSLVSRGAALSQQYWKPGMNQLDMTRPGAKNLLNALGDLKGAPADGEPWHVFDLSIAANEGRYVAVEISEEASALMNDWTDLSYEILEGMNNLRNVNGLPEIEMLNGHMPVMDANRYEWRYIQDVNTGQVTGSIKARTVAEADRLQEEAIARLNTLGTGSYAPKDVKDIAEYHDAVDSTFLFRLNDYSGIKQTGTGSGRNADFRLDVSGDLFEEMAVSVRNTFSDLKNRAIMANLADVMSTAQMMNRKMKDNYGNKLGGKAAFTPVETFTNLLLGLDRHPADSLVKRGHDYAESLLNATIGKTVDALPQAWRAVDRYLHGDKEKLTKAEYKLAEQALEGYTPFSHLAADPLLRGYLKLTQDADPYRAAKALQLGNRAVASAFLKIMNIVHPILNTLGMAVTLPAVTSQVLRRQGETVLDYHSRIGHIADYIDADKATINPKKLLHEAWHLVHHDADAMRTATELGYLEANMLEELNKLNNLRPSGFIEAMEGVAKYTDLINTPYNAVMKRYGKEVSAPTISERSETFTRAVAHMAGLAIVRNAGRPMSERAQHQFAYWFANQNIADFAPNIRGEAFRGTAGIPFGLFQSYSINMLQRLFGYVENKNHRALAIQMFTQTAVFGAQGLPGWQAANAMLYNLPDNKADERGATSLNERVYAALGKGAADVLMTGSVSNLPKLFGADSGINLWSSGDMNPRNPVAMPPSISAVSQVLGGITEGLKVAKDEVSKFGTDKPSDPGRFLEVVSNYHLVRGHKSLADLALGEKVDRRGNLIVEDTRSGAAFVSRALGTRLTNELLLSSAYQENAAAQSQRVAKFADIRRSMLRSIRDGSMTEDASADFMADYLLQGGQESEWKGFVNYATEMATDTRGSRALGLLVNKADEVFGYRQAKVARLLDAGVDPAVLSEK